MVTQSSGSSRTPPIAGGTGDPIADADGLLGLARGIEDQQPVEAEYAAAMVDIVEEKQDQAGQIEDRLENMLETQSARLQQVQSNPPGVLALPGTRARWQAQVAQAQTTVQLLHARLEAVREIKDGMTAHGSKIDALAAEKLEYREPKLADDFAELQAARRLHEIHMREQQEKRRVEQQGLAQDAAPPSGRSLAQGLSPTRSGSAT